MLDWLAYSFVRLIGACLCRLPPSVAVWCGQSLGRLACWLQPKRARIGELNLRAAFDGALDVAQARRIIRACYQQLGAGILEMLRLPVIDAAYLERYVAIDGLDHLEAAVRAGRGVIFLTGHFGNWEFLPVAAALLGYRMTALARAQEKFPRLYALLVSYRESKGCTIVHKGGAMKRLIAALEARQFVGIVGDQASRQGRFIDFFGRPALFAAGPFELAYEKNALILPAFIHRVRGAFHRIVLEPAMVLPDAPSKEAAVREGMERFAQALRRHVTEQPDQWLWMHKRWKYTPARRVLVLSDGKAGHVRQSLAVVDALRERQPEVRHEVIEVRYRSRIARLAALLWSWWAPGGIGATWCLARTLHPETSAILLRRYADLIVSCGASTASVNLLWSRVNRAKSIVLMNPSPLPLGRFDLVIAPRHDRLGGRRNVVETAGALSHVRDEDLLRAREQLHAHPKFRPAAAGHDGTGIDAARARPVVGVFLGGDTLHYELSVAFADTLITEVTTACQALEGWCLITTSRRTSPAVERLLSERLAQSPYCRFLLLASRDSLNGTMEGMLGWANVAVVTGESISMVSEACASGRRVVVVEPPLRRAARTVPTKHQRFLRGLVDGGYVRLVPVPELGLTIQRALKEPQPGRRLDSFARVRDAVARLL